MAENGAKKGVERSDSLPSGTNRYPQPLLPSGRPVTLPTLTGRILRRSTFELRSLRSAGVSAFDTCL